MRPFRRLSLLVAALALTAGVASACNDVNGTEQRAFAGNFLFSTGSNRFANRYTLGHFDLPMRNCTIALDDTVVVERGRLCPALS